jgi:hypothetical protein
MDLIIRDLLQVGSGCPSVTTITIPNGAGSIRVNIPALQERIPDDGCRQQRFPPSFHGRSLAQ